MDHYYQSQDWDLALPCKQTILLTVYQLVDFLRWTWPTLVDFAQHRSEAAYLFIYSAKKSSEELAHEPAKVPHHDLDIVAYSGYVGCSHENSRSSPTYRRPSSILKEIIAENENSVAESSMVENQVIDVESLRELDLDLDLNFDAAIPGKNGLDNDRTSMKVKVANTMVQVRENQKKKKLE